MVGGDRQPHVDRRIDDVLVALSELVRRQRSTAARTVRDDLVALVEQAAVPDLPQRPPDRLDVGRVERAVGVVHVDPEADPLRQLLPILEVLEHRLAALGVEALDAVGLDVRLRLQPQLLLDGDLDRQPMAVPAALALDAVAAHRAKARVDVLEHARQHVVRARLAVGRRRSLVEDPLRRSFAAAKRLGEDVALAPALEHLLLELRERLIGVDRTRHRRRSLCAVRRRVSCRFRRGCASLPRRARQRRRERARCARGTGGQRPRGPSA